MRKAVLSAVTATALLAGRANHSAQTQAPPAAAGGPAGPVPGSQEDLVANVGDRVFFDFDASVIESEGQETLSRQSAWLQKYPQNNVQIASNCDERRTAMQ